jgi:hypothetical protein
MCGSWTNIGIRSIYRGAGEEHKSNVVWYDVKAYWNEVDKATGIEDAKVSAKAVKRLVNGQLLIEKNGSRYNAIGTLVK